MSKKHTVEDCQKLAESRNGKFLWQPKSFVMPNGKSYRPDCYLPDENLWIEIKGYMRPAAKPKWNWFHSIYPNSELWDKEKLKQLNIL